VITHLLIRDYKKYFMCYPENIKIIGESRILEYSPRDLNLRIGAPHYYNCGGGGGGTRHQDTRHQDTRHQGTGTRERAPGQALVQWTEVGNLWNSEASGRGRPGR
jgi:hypothetical protein